VPLVGVVLAVGGLVTASEADQVGGDDAVPGRGEHRDHGAVEVRPRRLAVQQEHRGGVPRPLVDGVHPQPVDVEVVGLERVAGQVGEALVRGAQDVDGQQPEAPPTATGCELALAGLVVTAMICGERHAGTVIWLVERT
jgi:hypothetical protein